MLVTSIFSFFHYVFYPVTEKLYHFSQIEIVVSKCFRLVKGKIACAILSVSLGITNLKDKSIVKTCWTLNSKCTCSIINE